VLQTVIATRDGGVLELFFVFFVFFVFFFFFFLLCRYVVPGSCLSKYRSNNTADPLYQPDDRTGEKLMVEMRAETRTNKAKNEGIVNSGGVYI
jgi:hypothetical protein